MVLKLLISVSATSTQPFTMTNNRILNGSDTKTGWEHHHAERHQHGAHDQVDHEERHEHDEADDERGLEFERMNAGIRADIDTSSGPAGGSSMSWAASISSSSSVPVLANMNSRSGSIGVVVGLFLGLLAVEVRLEPDLVHLARGSGHHEQAEEQRQAHHDLVRRDALDAERAANEREHDHDAGEARQHDRRATAPPTAASGR